MESKTAAEYMDYLNRIGRRVGCYTESEVEAVRMTETEQLVLIGLLLDDNTLTVDELILPSNLTQFLIMNEEESDRAFLKIFKEGFLNHFYKQVEQLYRDHING